ncbi:RNase adapter RapZ [Sphingopyxis sp. GW247-27LB]|uniref:RNase adapter RapZ n=1 Tax=Sphingopyxis sp. GW247-27LB TaxID=2012632 RepID=UPI000BA5915A|nr:RNase adapter RapZ [Sphingopyxis sp. GW247-27LB]PAL20239.1 RNase adaptor protein RapZ [Sphingopyxis sp. GW247-27LB]
MSDSMPAAAEPRLLLITGLSGAGKSTVLKVLEDLGWEVVDNLPLSLLEPLIEAPVKPSEAARPIAVGIDSRSRGFKPSRLVKRIKELREAGGRDIQTLFLDCAGAELERRFSETRRRHPLAEDRPAADGIAREREMMESLRRWAEHVVDTTNYSSNDLQQEIRQRFADVGDDVPSLTVMSFGFARGLPRNADLVFDMRYLRNPHWDAKLRPGTGLDADVSAYIAADPAYEMTVAQIEALLLTLLPRYRAEGKSYVTIAFGCTGGRHRSVHVAERVAQALRIAGHAPNVIHRNLDSAPQDGLEGKPPPASGGKA